MIYLYFFKQNNIKNTFFLNKNLSQNCYKHLFWDIDMDLNTKTKIAKLYST